MILSEGTRRVLKLVTESRRADAKVLAKEAREGLAEQIRKAELEMALLDELVGNVPTEAIDVSFNTEQPVAIISKAEQKIAVLSSAVAQARTLNARRVSTNSVEALMLSEGQEPPTKTAIGIILNHAPDFRRLDKGVYQWIGDVEEGENAELPM